MEQQNGYEPLILLQLDPKPQMIGRDTLHQLNAANFEVHIPIRNSRKKEGTKEGGFLRVTASIRQIQSEPTSKKSAEDDRITDVLGAGNPPFRASALQLKTEGD